MVDSDYLTVTRHEYRRLKGIAERAMRQIDDERFFATIGGEDNSVAIVVKHMAGNMLSRWRDFLTSDGEKPDRNRDGEFEIGTSNSRAQLEEFWEAGWACLFDAIDPLEPADLSRAVRIRGEPHSVMQAVSRQLSHYAYHVGQIVFVAKHLCGDAWQTLSIAKGESERFNAASESYLEQPGSS